MGASLNESWSAQPSSVSGAANAAPMVHDLPRGPKMTVTPPRPAAAPTPAQQASADASADPVADAHAAMTEASNAFGKHLAAGGDRMNAEQHRAHLAAFRESDAAKSVDTHAASVTALRDAAVAERDRVRQSPTRPGDTATELRHTRTWDGEKAKFDAIKDGGVGAAVRRSIKAADREQLSVLLERLPGYLESRGQPAEYLDAAVAEVVPELAEAQRAARQAERDCQVINHNATTLRSGFASGHVPAHLVDPRSIG